MFNKRTSQKGAALVISLIMLVLMTLLVVLSMKGSHVQEQMAGNQKFHVEATLAAETGIAEAIACVKNAKNPRPVPSGSSSSAPPNCETQTFRTTIVPLDTSGTTSKGAYWIQDICSTASPAIPDLTTCNPTLSNNPDGQGPRARARIKSIGYSVSTTTGLPTPSATLSSPLVLAQYAITAIYDDCNKEPGDYGLKSKQIVDLNGNSTFTTSIYGQVQLDTTNQVTVDGDITTFGTIGNGTITGSKYCPGSGCDDNPVTSPIPMVQDNLTRLKNEAWPNSIPSAINCSSLTALQAFNPNITQDANGVIDLKGATYLCNTPATGSDKINLKLANGSLYFNGTGNIDFGGSNQLGLPPVAGGDTDRSLKIVAQGSIDLLGNGNNYIDVWTDGDFWQHGSSMTYGSVIAQGDIRFSGGAEFTARRQGNPGSCSATVNFQ